MGEIIRLDTHRPVVVAAEPEHPRDFYRTRPGPLGLLLMLPAIAWILALGVLFSGSRVNEPGTEPWREN